MKYLIRAQFLLISNFLLIPLDSKCHINHYKHKSHCLKSQGLATIYLFCLFLQLQGDFLVISPFLLYLNLLKSY